jgi:hypothetical protein
LDEFGVEHELWLWPQQWLGQFYSAGFQKLVKLKDMCFNVGGGDGGYEEQ